LNASADTVLVIGSQKVAELLGKLLVPRYYRHYVYTPSGAKARRALSAQEWGLVVVNAPLADDDAEALALEVFNDHRTFAILLCDAESESRRTELLTLARPVEPALLEQTLQTLAAAGTHVATLREENRRLTAKLEEARLIGRAKCVLVAQKVMTESEAHRFIEKRAMDSRLPKREVAKDILQAYRQ
jgi:response regulator NasT